MQLLILSVYILGANENVPEENFIAVNIARKRLQRLNAFETTLECTRERNLSSAPFATSPSP
jgi:hypothetical protein